MSQLAIPDRLPILSRGKHRSPRKGACFMEMASYLAGERWSDHPACTHPLVAMVARGVNDHTSDRGRSRLAPLIPSVIGLTSEDPRLDAQVALRCARTSLPVAPAEKQRVLAVGVLVAERVRGDLDGRAVGRLQPASEAALRAAPHAAAWARRFTAEHQPSPRQFRRRGAPAVVTAAIRGAAEACVPDRDALLYELLVGTIGDAVALIGSDAVPAEAPEALERLARQFAG